jgi:ABC-type bacteriocin/lantibiotic exporter with double-glycine peptidase domain
MNMGLLIFGLYNNYFGTLTVAQTYSMITIFNLMFLPTRKLNFSLNAIITGFVALERFEKILSVPDKEHLKNDSSLPVGSMKLENLNSSYQDEKIDALFENVMEKASGPVTKKGSTETA